MTQTADDTWAVNIAISMAAQYGDYGKALVAMIEKHEQPPVDPDLVTAHSIYMDWPSSQREVECAIVAALKAARIEGVL